MRLFSRPPYPVLAALVLFACQQAPERGQIAPPARYAGPPPVVLPVGFVQLGQCFASAEKRLVAARDSAGQTFALLYPNGLTSDVPPLPVDGGFMHCRHAVAERDDGVDFERWVLVTRGSAGGQPRTITHVLTPRSNNGGGLVLRRLTRIMKRGEFRGARTNADRNEAAILYSRGANDRAVLIDLSAPREVDDTPLSVTPEDLRDLEFVGGWRVEITSRAGRPGVVLRATGPRGEGLEFALPGEFAAATHGGGAKTVVTTQAGAVHHHVVPIPAGPTGSHPASSNAGLAGAHKRLDYQEVAGQGRFVEVVHDASRGQSTVRILDIGGTVVATLPYAGEFRRAVSIRVATTLNGRPALLPRRALAFTGDGITDVVVIDLLNGRQVSGARANGGFVSLSANPAGAATLTTTSGAIVVPGE
jgi:hypothetical protein